MQRADDIIVVLLAEAGQKHFEVKEKVKLINPMADTVATATFQGADVGWYIKAEHIVLKNKQAAMNHVSNQQPQNRK